MCTTRSLSRKEQATRRPGAAAAALILAAHGESDVPDPNRALREHAAALKDNLACQLIGCGVMNGAPGFDDALAEAISAGADEIIIYPFFMSDGYFVRKLLPEKLAAAGVEERTSLLPPLGLDPGLASVMMEHALAAAGKAGFPPTETRLLVIGHGSKSMPASANATLRVSDDLAAIGNFLSVETAFLEEPPFLLNVLASHKGAWVVSGFFAGNGLHSTHDVPATIEESGARAVYSGPVGASDDVRQLIVEAVKRYTT